MSQSATASQIDQLFKLEGRTSIVTGAAAGIGYAIAQLFAAAGAKVVLADLNGDAAAGAASKLEAPAGAIGVAVDISDEASVTAMVAAAVKAFGSVDVLVNNAGIYPHTPFMETTVKKWDMMHAVNTRGAYLCMREAIKHMKAAGHGGSIVNVSSVASLQPVIFENADYASSKAGVNAMTKAAALEFAVDGIRVNALLPGGVATEQARTGMVAHNLKGPILQAERKPLGRGTPLQIASVALFLASEASSYITGQLLVVDGGFQVS
jgi:NAD(P)-dependent dehydrogenase (short-subunit alcohol dehydrogenase family)